LIEKIKAPIRRSWRPEAIMA